MLVTSQGESYAGNQAILQLDSLAGQVGAVKLLGDDILQFQNKLEEFNMGGMTYGLAFHTEFTSVLRYPYNRDDFLDKARNYILSRVEQLEIAAERVRDENSESSVELRRQAAEHQQNLSNYTQTDNYSQLLQRLHQLFDFFETELGREDRSGVWLGGTCLSIADITLGLYLHRVWQLGMEMEYFQEGVRPQLSVFYQRIRNRPAFARVTKWKENDGQELKLKQPEDAIVDQAKVGLGVGLVLGGLYLVKKLLRK